MASLSLLIFQSHSSQQTRTSDISSRRLLRDRRVRKRRAVFTQFNRLCQPERFSPLIGGFCSNATLALWWRLIHQRTRSCNFGNERPCAGSNGAVLWGRAICEKSSTSILTAQPWKNAGPFWIGRFCPGLFLHQSVRRQANVPHCIFLSLSWKPLPSNDNHRVCVLHILEKKKVCCSRITPPPLAGGQMKDGPQRPDGWGQRGSIMYLHRAEPSPTKVSETLGKELLRFCSFPSFSRRTTSVAQKD